MPKASAPTSFWGNPTLKPRDKDVVRFVSFIRETTKDYSDKKALGIATSSLAAVLHFIVHRFGPKEALALIDRMRSEITEGIN